MKIQHSGKRKSRGYTGPYRRVDEPFAVQREHVLVVARSGPLAELGLVLLKEQAAE